ncbi:MAG: hypothetical protein ACPGGK_12745 [Pikeienuella sp.]
MDNFDAFRTYWKVYGGWKDLLRSYYFWFSALLTAAFFPAWIRRSSEGDLTWPLTALSIGPSFISFSLGAMAIILAFSNEKFMALIQQKGADTSYFIRVVSSLFHFIIVQALSILVSLFALSWQYNTISALSFFLTVYGIAVAMAAASNLMDMSEILNKMAKK